MAMVNCPHCSQSTKQGGYAVWQIIVAICFFPIGLLALMAGRQPATCEHCGKTFS